VVQNIILTFAPDKQTNDEGKKIAVRRETRLCRGFWIANIRLFLPRCSQQTKSLSKIKDYGYRENDKKNPSEVRRR
jgi:hypothetical protein